MTDPDRAVAKRAFDAMMLMRKIDIAAIETARLGLAVGSMSSARNGCFGWQCDGGAKLVPAAPSILALRSQ